MHDRDSRVGVSLLRTVDMLGIALVARWAIFDQTHSVQYCDGTVGISRRYSLYAAHAEERDTDVPGSCCGEAALLALWL